jgi:Flp pilus assembly protein TadG
MRKGIMRAELPLLRKGFNHADRGNTLIIFTLFIVALFGFAALAVDVGNVFRQHRYVHNGTDAAALAGVWKFTDPSIPTDPNSQKTYAIAEARDIAAANSVITNEIAAGDTGTITVGQWAWSPGRTSGVFTVNAWPYTAVRVPAARSVPLYFAPVVGLRTMQPRVVSIAALQFCGIPIGVTQDAVSSALSTNGLLILTKDNAGPGNWGTLQFEDESISGYPEVEPAVENGTCSIRFGQVPDKTGEANAIHDGIAARIGAGNIVVILPVVDAFPPGHSGVLNVVDLLLVQLATENNPDGNGDPMKITVSILGQGLPALRNYATRMLVQ